MSKLPQIESLYYAALQALSAFNEAVPYRRMDDEALRILDLEIDDTDSEARLRERLGFARSALKRIGAVDNAQRGFWEITDVGRGYLRMSPDEGLEALSVAINESYADRTADPGFLENARKQAQVGEPIRLTVRELIGQWNVSRRGSAINQQIHDDLEAAGLRSEPDFANTWIDGLVTIVATGGSPEESASVPAIEAWEDDVSLSVGSLESANRGVESVLMDDSLVHAQSVMMRHDYSQLAVMSGPRSVRGAITWESIAQEHLRNPDADRVSDCLVEAHLVRPTAHLLDVVPVVADRGFVLVQAVDGSLSGIVTMADLSVQFANLANPFVLIGEIERWLRKALDSAFSPHELAEFRNPDDPDRDIESAANLTLGEMIRAIEGKANWERLGWTAERTVFLEAMGDVRRIRNETMHFSPDPVSETDLENLRAFLRWLTHLMSAR